MLDNLSFSKKLRIRHKEQFQRIFQLRRRLFSSYYVLYSQENGCDYPRMGLITSKKNVRKAVTRNRIRRVARETFRLRQIELSGLDVVLVANRKAQLATKEELQACLDNLFSQLIALHRSSSLGS